MHFRSVIRGALFGIGVVVASFVLGKLAVSYAAPAPQLSVTRPLAPVTPNDDNGNDQPQANLNQPNIPSAASIPGTEAYEIAQLQMQVDELAAAVDDIRQRLARDHDEFSATLASLRRPYCSADTEVRDPVSGATESCLPYLCNGAEGTCRTLCRNSSDCAAGYVCDPGRGNGVCVKV